MTLRVAALTTGLRTPSSRFRVRQHIAPLRAYDIEAREFRPFIDDRAENALGIVHPKSIRIRHFPPAYPFYAAQLGLRLASRIPGIMATWRHDISWLSRGLCQGWPTLEARIGKPLVLDVDDAIWLREPFGEKQARAAAQRADVVVVCNAYLAEWFARYCRRIEQVPTGVDGRVFFPLERRNPGPFIVGWTGTSSNFRYLFHVRDALSAFLRHVTDARLRIVADVPPPDLGLRTDSVEFIQWSETTEAAVVQTMDVGIMPLLDDAWSRGKCAFKVIQYMACGLPVIASRYGPGDCAGCDGMALAARNDAQWVDRLIHLYENRDERVRIGISARRNFLENFDLPVITGKLARIFQSLG